MTSRRLLIGGAIAVLVVVGGAATYGAERRASNAEEAYVAARLENASCLDGWGTNEGAASGNAAVTDLAPLGVRVTVRVPYAYRVETDGEPVFADTASEAVYEVTLLGTRRVGGDDISPC